MIPYGRQSLDQTDIDAVVEVLQSDWLTQGPTIERFEQAMAERCQADFAVAVCNATAALHIACLASGLGPGDRLWTTPNTFLASANCGRYCGADVDFVDIEGESKPRPKYRTRVKMLWDDQYLYIAAELEEPDVKATLTQHDSVIFKDNDFEVFIRPLPDTDSYYEFEINALNTGWDLFLPKPYNQDGQPDNSWDIQGLKSAIAVQGTLNKSTDKDRGWTVEIAYPLSAFASRQAVPKPRDGTTWRINFSRVEWTAGKPNEDNWVWSSQGVIDMHVPERWGFLHFLEQTTTQKN